MAKKGRVRHTEAYLRSFSRRFKSIFTSAVVKFFGVVACSILVTLVFNGAFVNVWSINERSILDSKFATSMHLHEELKSHG